MPIYGALTSIENVVHSMYFAEKFVRYPLWRGGDVKGGHANTDLTEFYSDYNCFKADPKTRIYYYVVPFKMNNNKTVSKGLILALSVALKR